MAIARIAGLFAGHVESFVAADGQPMTSAIRKRPLAEAWLGPSGFTGDESAEAGHHTADRDVHVFAEENYAAVETLVGRALPRPAFGENLTATGLGDDDVHVGDCYAIGDAVICVTQPTERCRSIGRHVGLPKILKALHVLEVCGFYARVVREGRVTRDDSITLTERPPKAWSIRRLHRAMFEEHLDQAVVADILAIAQLSREWKDRFLVLRGRHARGEPLNSSLAEL